MGTRCNFPDGGCRRPVLWVRTSTGARMPVEPGEDPDGTVAVFRDAAGVWVGRVLKAGEQPDAYERRHVTHFATCPAKARADAEAKAAQALRTAPANVTVLADYQQNRRGTRGRR